MKPNNTITQEKKNTAIVEYQANGETVKLSPASVKRYLTNGGGNVTDEEVVMFMSLCRYQHLNPFLREAYLIKYGDRNPATMVVGKDVFLKRAKRRPEFAGLEAGIILRGPDGNVYDRQGTFYQKETEQLLGGWCRVYVKDYAVQFYTSVSLDEYIGRKSNGEINGQWTSKPATMIRKVAIAQALKEAFPEDNAGMMIQEESAAASAVELDENVVAIQEETKETPVEAPKEAPKEDIESALFEG